MRRAAPTPASRCVASVRQEKQITVCLLQTMIGHYPDFSSGYFDAVVADECHRSIYGTWQTAFDQFRRAPHRPYGDAVCLYRAEFLRLLSVPGRDARFLLSDQQSIRGWSSRSLPV